MDYIIISEEKAFSITGYSSGLNTIIPTRILTGDYAGFYACSVASESEFPELFADIKPLTIVNLSANSFIKNTTNVNLSGYGVEIPDAFQFVFSEDKFILNEFEVPLTTLNNKKYVDLAYFIWKEFRVELDTKNSRGEFIYAALKRSLMPLWDYVATQIQNQNIIKL